MIDRYKVDGYLVSDDTLKKVTWIDSELFIVEDGWLVLYREYLDGPLVYEEEAREMFPEAFV